MTSANSGATAEHTRHQDSRQTALVRGSQEAFDELSSVDHVLPQISDTGWERYGGQELGEALLLSVRAADPIRYQCLERADHRPRSGRRQDILSEGRQVSPVALGVYWIIHQEANQGPVVVDIVHDERKPALGLRS